MSKNNETKQGMNVYKVETGATYYFAAETPEAALAAAWIGFEEYDDIESLRADEEGITAELVDPSVWADWTFNDDGEGDMEASFADLVARTTEPGVLTCSEWP